MTAGRARGEARERIASGCLLIFVCGLIGSCYLLFSLGFMLTEGETEFWLRANRVGGFLRIAGFAMGSTELIPMEFFNRIQTWIFRRLQRRMVHREQQVTRIRLRVHKMRENGLYLWPLLIGIVLLFFLSVPIIFLGPGDHRILRYGIVGLYYLCYMILVSSVIMFLFFYYYSEWQDYKTRALSADRHPALMAARILANTAHYLVRLAFWTIILLSDIIIFLVPSHLIYEFLDLIRRGIEVKRIRWNAVRLGAMLVGLSLILQYSAALRL